MLLFIYKNIKFISRLTGRAWGFILEKDLSMEQLHEIHCAECGAYLGQVVLGYVRVVQCYCGELISIPKPSMSDQENLQLSGQTMAA
jgi:hypothetical protein